MRVVTRAAWMLVGVLPLVGLAENHVYPLWVGLVLCGAWGMLLAAWDIHRDQRA